MRSLWRRFKAKLEDLSGHYPPRWWWPVVRIYGGPHGVGSRVCYMTRMIFPPTPWGRLYLHTFHREDIDRDPHDHPFPFWTLPLNQGYFEEVMEHSDTAPGRQCFKQVHVPRWRFSYRPPTHTHRITHTDSGRWPLVTLVWRGKATRKWGFWIRRGANLDREWVYHRKYEDGALGLESDTGLDVHCPGKALPDRMRPRTKLRRGTQ